MAVWPLAWLSVCPAVSCLSNASLNCPYTSGHSTVQAALLPSPLSYAASGSVSSLFTLCLSPSLSLCVFCRSLALFAFINCCLYLASFYLIWFPSSAFFPSYLSISFCLSLSLSPNVLSFVRFGLLFWSPVAAIKPNLIDLSLSGLLISWPLCLDPALAAATHPHPSPATAPAPTWTAFGL